MVKQVIYTDLDKEYYGEVIVNTDGHTVKKRISNPSTHEADDVWRRYYQVDGFINGQNVFSKTCSEKEELIELSMEAEVAVYKSLEIIALSSKKQTVENKLEELGYTK